MFRLSSPNLGRWHSPDPMGGDITKPQSLNRYAYAANNPAGLIDPLGLDPCTSSNTGPGRKLRLLTPAGRPVERGPRGRRLRQRRCGHWGREPVFFIVLTDRHHVQRLDGG